MSTREEHDPTRGRSAGRPEPVEEDPTRGRGADSGESARQDPTRGDEERPDAPAGERER